MGFCIFLQNVQNPWYVLYRVVNSFCRVFELFCGVPPWAADFYRICVYMLYQGSIRFGLGDGFLIDQMGR